MKLSYCIGTHNEEARYIRTLFDQLLKHKDLEDEIIVVDDFSTNVETLQVLEEYKDRISLHQHALNKDFAAHKNYINSLATGDYIFNIDADETPNVSLLLTLKEILLSNPNVDLFSVPRINIVQDLPDEYLAKWGWRKNEQQMVNYPDLQNRIYKNKPEIKWVNPVHEVITGTNTHTSLPAFDEEGKVITDYCLFHPKLFSRQLSQNEFYETIN
jgi:glycosyltransferase involved in cell wall biosynthesis